ncbi:MAG: YhcH/YjgK/YiaL family protein [Rikenellaceae bacterium]
MILDSLQNSALYSSVCPRMARAFELVSKLDLASLPEGKHILDGEEIFVNIMERELKKVGEAKVEVHNKYADIQILLVGEKEGFGWIERKDLKEAAGDFDTAKDVQFFADEYQTIYTLKPGQFTILMPEDGHAPMIGEGKVKKAIVKVMI